MRGVGVGVAQGPWRDAQPRSYMCSVSATNEACVSQTLREKYQEVPLSRDQGGAQEGGEGMKPFASCAKYAGHPSPVEVSLDGFPQRLQHMPAHAGLLVREHQVKVLRI